jgi:hypothetical protein
MKSNTHFRPSFPLQTMLTLSKGLCLSTVLGAASLAWSQDKSAAQEVWINPGFVSYHFPKHGLSFNNFNPGLGAEWRQSSDVSWSGGFFHNSDWARSYYAGAYWTPLHWAGWRWGAFVGLINGYPQMLDGGVFPFLTPVATREWDQWGVGMSLLPDYENRLHGAFTVQVKYKWKP